MSALDVIESWPVTTVAAGWRRADDSSTSRGQTDHVFALASVTKPLVALAVLVAVEERSLSLDRPAGPPGSTVAHLLSHSSGLAPENTENATLSRLATRRIYSNYGFELLGRALEEATGIETATYLQEAILDPLGMTSTGLHGSPAHGATSTVADLLRLGAELANPTLLSPETLAAAVTPVFPQLTGVLPGFGRQTPNPWGLGFELKGSKQPHWTGSRNSPETFGHFGRAGTFFWYDPVAEVFCTVLTDRPFGPWAAESWPTLSDAVLEEAGPIGAARPERWTTTRSADVDGDPRTEVAQTTLDP
ncbi:MAG: serine hydrolase domain-containing protein [Acidimicrobiales bacterium]